MLNSYSDVENLLSTLLDLRRDVCQEGRETFARWQPHIRQRAFCISAINLAYYLALRRRDLRLLQTELMAWGLSSLGRAEARVLPNLDAVIHTLGLAAHRDPAALPRRPRMQAFFRGWRMLEYQTNAVFGPPPKHRWVRIMVTLPTEAARDYPFVRDLMLRGMNVARINCAHDSPDEWGMMIDNVRRAETETGRICKVHMDLGGPKNRTGEIWQAENGRRVVPGDRLLLRRNTPAASKEYPFQIQATLPEVLDQLKVGAAVWIDDGKLGARVEAILPEGAVLHVTRTREKGERLKPDKGLNFPDTTLKLAALTEKDCQDLDFIARRADIIGYSFVQEVSDVEALQAELAARMPDIRRIAVIVKVETHRAIQNLPELIVRAAGKQPLGVMIARGDLAVEIGYERTAEIQEEILWLCEAAHVPVVWATQVLEQLVKKGMPSRAEMTDAAMSQRAECVMLNKGPFVAEAVTNLDDVLTRMKGHQLKKTQQLRALRAWPKVVED